MILGSLCAALWSGQHQRVILQGRAVALGGDMVEEAVEA